MEQIDFFSGSGAWPLATSNQPPAPVASAPQEPHLIVYANRSVYLSPAGTSTEYKEGATTVAAQARLRQIKSQLASGYLDTLIDDCIANPKQLLALDPKHIDALTMIANSITSEKGRGLVGLTFMQLAIKAICPAQSIRLHKAGKNIKDFSWREGVSMRVIGKNFITPVLRKYSFINSNKDGAVMTRTLAENYPFTPLYKAVIRGAKDTWLQVVDWVELGELAPIDALRLLASLLLNRTNVFKGEVSKLLALVKQYNARTPNFQQVFDLVSEFVEDSGYSARIFEIAMHAFMQALDEAGLVGGYLKTMSQMRSANKKHGNIGDIELTNSPGLMDIYEAWDAKYGKPYLRDELDELGDKLAGWQSVEQVGFVTNLTPDRRPEIISRMRELEEEFGTKVCILSFKEWVDSQLDGYDADPQEIGELWLLAIAESIGQLRRDRAPIDEPTHAWVEKLIELLTRELA